MSARGFILVAGLVGLASPLAQALGIVRAPESVALGASLNFAVTVRVAGDESLTPGCVAAEVLQGDQRLAPSAVRVALEPADGSEERLVRVLSTAAIDEPVVTITLTLGCANRLERRFTVFADPPLVTTVAAAPPQPEPAAPAPREMSSAPSNGSTARSDAAAAPLGTDAVVPSGQAPAVARSEIAPAPAAAPRVAAKPRAPRVASAPPRRPSRSAAATVAAGGARTPGAAQAAARALPAPAQGPRLQLEAVEPVARVAAAASAAETAQAAQDMQVRPAAMAASAAQAEQAASAALAGAVAAADRMRAVEEGVARLREDIERDREQLLTLRAKLARAESTSRLAPWLGAGMALLGALALWLWLRMRRLQREQQAQWWAASRTAQNEKQPPPNPPTLHPMTLPPHMVPSTPPVRAPAPMVVAAPKPAAGFRDSIFTSQQEPRDVSIEELIDLEQQAEFFVVLGQDDSAIDLLMGHIRSSGGTSPLPYLKLLEIYRRLGDRESYERTRERFNHRFNAYAPDWDSDLQHGRSLDEYPGVIKRLQATWRSPLDAMAELEALMFRRDGGELFELPAYREVLFLYSMARDLLDHEGGPPSKIDVLLPLSEPEAGGAFEPTTARPHLFTSVGALSEANGASEPPIEVLRASGAVPTAGDEATSVYGVVDLDLTKPLPMHDDTVVFRRDSDQRSDFADLPPPPPRKG